MQPLVPRSDAEHEIFASLPKRRRIVLLGSTGSIGKSTLDIIKKFPEQFELVGISAFGNNLPELARQIQEHSPKSVVIVDPSKKEELEKLSDFKVQAGSQALDELCSDSEVDVVVAGIVGAAGLQPVLSALKASKIVALANKESLVVGGELVRQVSKQVGPRILPVDSEHSALFQSLLGVKDQEISSLILTASGGPFLRSTPSELATVTPQQAIKHPRWQMGPKISVDSATLVNKGLELIEAHYLYAMPAAKLSAVIHPQSLVHAIVQTTDGNSILQVSTPDMREPIAFALNYPRTRLPHILPQIDFADLKRLEFEAVDNKRFPAIGLALGCIESGPSACIAYNEANEFAVARFLEGSLRFIDIIPFIEEILAANLSSKVTSSVEVQNLQQKIREHCDFTVKRFRLN